MADNSEATGASKSDSIDLTKTPTHNVETKPSTDLYDQLLASVKDISAKMSGYDRKL